MEWSEYNGPESPELEAAWPSLSSDQHTAIQENASDESLAFFLAITFGDMQGAVDLFWSTLNKAHEIAGIPQLTADQQQFTADQQTAMTETMKQANAD